MYIDKDEFNDDLWWIAGRSNYPEDHNIIKVIKTGELGYVIFINTVPVYSVKTGWLCKINDNAKSVIGKEVNYLAKRQRNFFYKNIDRINEQLGKISLNGSNHED
jgi:hypothetical protein